MKILIVNDSELIYKRLQKLISKHIDETNDTIEIISQFDNLLMDVYKKAPDVLLLNTYSLRGTIVEIIRAIKTILPQIHIICLTEFSEKAFEKILKVAGADYFVDIASEIEKIPDIIKKLKAHFDS